MSVIILKRGAPAPAPTKLLKVTVTTSWPYATRYVIGGKTVSYSDNTAVADQVYEVEEGTVVNLYGYRNSSSSGAARVVVDGTTATTNTSSTGSFLLYEYTVTSDCTLALKMYGENGTQWTITTS